MTAPSFPNIHGILDSILKESAENMYEYKSQSLRYLVQFQRNELFSQQNINISEYKSF